MLQPKDMNLEFFMFTSLSFSVESEKSGSTMSLTTSSFAFLRRNYPDQVPWCWSSITPSQPGKPSAHIDFTIVIVTLRSEFVNCKGWLTVSDYVT